MCKVHTWAVVLTICPDLSYSLSVNSNSCVSSGLPPSQMGQLGPSSVKDGLKDNFTNAVYPYVIKYLKSRSDIYEL